jgi:hypothetical protein
MDHKHPPLTTLHQIQLSAKPSKTKLFQRLATEYKNKREPYTLLTIKIRPFWRKVKAVHFVRFMTLSPQPRLTAQIEENAQDTSLIRQLEVEWKRLYQRIDYGTIHTIPELRR